MKPYLSILYISFLLLFSASAFGQSVTINGNEYLEVNQQRTFSVNANGASVQWDIIGTGGEIVSGRYTSNALVKATTGANFTLQVQLNNGSSGFGGKEILVTPLVPDAITDTYANCGVTLSKGSAPTGVTWYWQTSISGESQSATAQAATYIPTSSGTYYLRARSDGTNGQWSVSSRSKAVTMPSPPNEPSVSGNNPREICDGQTTTLSISNADSNLTYKWYKGATYLGGDGPSKSVSPSSSSVYSVTATNSAGCVSTARTITVNVLDLPQPLPNDGQNSCSSSSIVVSVHNTKTVNGTVRNDMTHVWYRNSNRTNPITAQTVPNTPSGTLATQITVTDQTNTSYWVATKIGGCESALTQVDATFVNYTLNPGSINTTTQVICYDSDANTISNISAASGGDGNTYTYTWMYANSQNGTYTAINNTNNESYNPSTDLTADRWYKRKVESCSLVAFTAPVQIDVKPALDGGTIQAPSAVCYNGDPNTISSTDDAGNGLGGYTYEWSWANSQNGTYNAIGNSNNKNYDPGNLTASRWYQRKVTSCGQTAHSNKIQIVVAPQLSPPTGTTAYTVCANTNATLSLTPDADAVEVRWYSSNTGGNYLGSGSISRGAGTYYASSYYNASCESSRTAVVVSSLSILDPGTINDPNETICYGEDPSAITSATDPSGGDTRLYRWQYKDAGTNTWTYIGTATSNTSALNYDPPAGLQNTRTYRREVASCGGKLYSNEVTVTVIPQITQPTFADNTVSFCGTGTVPLGVTNGDGTVTARWYTQATGGSFVYEGATYDAAAQNQTYYVSFRSNTLTSCESSRTAITLAMTNDITWSLDADDDGYAVQKQQACDSPGTGWKPEDLPLGDCNDANAAANTPRIWYADLDENGQGDGLGDPDSPSELLCEAPAGYVDNSDDLCPNHVSPTNDCFFTPTDCNPSGTPPSGQRSGHNYVYSRTYQNEVDNIPGAKFENNDNYIQSITYFDGLGRPVQGNAVRQSPDGNDIITHMAYDSHGRMTKDWLPVPEAQQPMGRFKTGDIEGLIKGYYNANYGDDFTGLTLADQNPYSEKTFEASPLNRVTQQAAPGKDWKHNNGHEIEFDYTANTAADAVKRFDVVLTPSGKTYVPALQTRPDYVVGELRKSITKDENYTGSGKDHTTEEFSDKQGRVVLKRAYNNEEAHDTYYVYDDFGNLTYVLPPKMNGGVTHLDDLGYQYVYDYRNRLVEKKIPGKGKEYIVYNNLDQPILTQDANQRAKSPDEWLFTKYDSQGRVAYTGKATAPDGTSRTTVQNEVAGLTVKLWVDQGTTDRNNEFAEDVAIFYDNGAYPDDNSTVSLSEVLTINYYDTYVDHGTNVPTQITPLGESVAIDATANNVQGLATGSRVKVLDQNPSKWITTVSYYDDKGRPIYTHSTNDFLGTVDIMETELDFIGKVRKGRSTHTRGTDTLVTLDNFAYDHTGRLIAQTQCVGDETLGTSCGGSSGGSGVPPTETLNGAVNTQVVASDYIEVLPTATLNPGTELFISTTTIDSGGDQELIVYNDYDEIGQLRYKKVGGDPNFTNLKDSPGLQRVDYAYNIRGWLKTINQDSFDDNDLFNFGIKYNDPQGGGQALYNGNISQTLWSTMSVNTPNANGQLNDVSTGYTYSYDALNRITGAKDNTGNYNLGGYDTAGNLTQPLTYDKNGNIQTLYRTGHTNANFTAFGTMDQLTYVYDHGNQLQSVGDGAVGTGFADNNPGGIDYAYDANGNMTQDLNKGIQAGGITYNHLNLPTQVNVNGVNTGNIVYIYDATGVKLQKIATEGSSVTTDYAGNYIYKNGNLEFFSTPEGYIEPNTSGGHNYIYQYKDHLGNVRLSYSDGDGDGKIDLADINGTDLDGDGDASNEIVEENNYYPFGLKHKGYNTVVNSTNTAQDFKYNGVEQEGSLGLDLYEMELRQYDPAIARFIALDPIIHHSMSTYTAFDNNPIFYSDPSGGDSRTIYDFNGNAWTVDCENGECDNARKQESETKPKYQIYNISSVGDITIKDGTDNFEILTAYGSLYPEDLGQLATDKKADLITALQQLPKAQQISLLKKLGVDKKIIELLTKNATKAGGLFSNTSLFALAGIPNALREDGLAGVPIVGAVLSPLNDDHDGENALIANDMKWDDVKAGANSMMSTPDLTNVVLIYTNENLWNEPEIKANDIEILDSKYPSKNYKHVYYGTQFGNKIHIFGSHSNLIQPGDGVD